MKTQSSQYMALTADTIEIIIRNGKGEVITQQKHEISGPGGFGWSVIRPVEADKRGKVRFVGLNIHNLYFVSRIQPAKKGRKS